MRKKFEEVAQLGARHAELKKSQDIGAHLQKLSEEFGELAQSVNKITGLKSLKKKETMPMVYKNILEESADCTQIIFIIAHLAGYSYNDLKKKLGKKNKSYAKFIAKLEKKFAEKNR